MKALLFLLAAWLLPAHSMPDSLPSMNAPTEVFANWEKKKPAPAEPQGCKFCYLKLSTTPVAGATHYDWIVEGANADFSKTTTGVRLPQFYAEPGDITVKVRARNASATSPYFEKTWTVEVPSDCCLY